MAGMPQSARFSTSCMKLALEGCIWRSNPPPGHKCKSSLFLYQVYSFGILYWTYIYIYILYRYLQQLRRSIPLHQRELSCVWRNKIFFEPSSSMKTTPWKLLGKVACGSPLSRPSVRSARKYQTLEICEAKSHPPVDGRNTTTS